MSIATAITNLQGKIANAYTAIENKGGTLPATQNAENLSATIDAIPSGGSSSKFGATIDDVFQTTTTGDETSLKVFGGVTSLTFTGVTNLPANGMAYKFYGSPVTSISFPAMTSAGAYAFQGAFQNCTSLLSVSFPALSSTLGNSTFEGAFADCTSLSSVSFPNIVAFNNSTFNSAFKKCASLTSISFPEAITVGANAFKDAFHGCTNLTTVSFPKLATITGVGAFSTAFGTGQSSYPAAGVTYLSFPALSSIVSNSTGSGAIFYNNKKITRIDLPVLTEMKKTATATTNNLVTIFNGCDDLVEIHFGAANQTVIEASDGYATKWGAPNASCQIYFDL